MKKSDSVRKVRLKTISGVLTLCYRSSQSPSHEGDHNSSERSSVEKVSHEGSQVPVATNEPSFGSLPELFDVQAQFSINDGHEFDGRSSLMMDLQPDFSTYNFWASESGLSLSNAVVGLSDTVSRCDHDEIMLDHAPAVLDFFVEDGKGPDNDLQNSATKSDLPQSQNSINNSCIAKDTTDRERCWDLSTLELEEDIFECAMNWNLLKEFTDGERDIEREKSIVDNYLVDRSPPQPSNVDSNVENLDSDNLLVYAPNRYLDKDASCIFQSSFADLELGKLDVNSRTIDDESIIRPFQKGSSCRKKGNELREKNRPKENGRSTDVNRRNTHSTSWMEVCSKEVLDVTTARSIPSETENGENDHTPRMLHLNHRRRRFSAPGLKRSKLMKPSSTLTSLDRQWSPNLVNREKIIQAGRRSSRGNHTPTRKADTIVRHLKPEYCSDSPPSGGESDQDCHKNPLRTTSPRKFSLPSDDGKKRLRRRVDISLRESYASGPLNVIPTPNQSTNRGGAPTTLSLSLNPCLLRKKRTTYKDVCHDAPDNTNEIETRLDMPSENHSQAHSPKTSKLLKASTSPRGSSAIAQLRRSPWDGNRKKVRTFRRRAPQTSPTASARKLPFYSQIIHGGGSGQVLQQGIPSPELDVGHAGTKLAEKRGRRRVPLPLSSVEILQGWLHDNLPDPYPSRQEKEDLVFQTGLKLSQIDNWLGNARQKLRLKSRAVKDLSESSSSSELKKRSRRKRSYPLKMKI